MLIDLSNIQNGLSHMPFVVADGSGEPVLLFCMPEAEPTNHVVVWKLHYLDIGGHPVRIPTGLPPDMIECAPTAWHDRNGWHLSFIAGGSEADPAYRLYRMDAGRLAAPLPPVALLPTMTGFAQAERIAYGEKTETVHLRVPGSDLTLEFPGMEILRVSYAPDRPHIVYVSAALHGHTVDAAHERVTVYECDTETGARHILLADGVPPYKCATFGREMYYTRRLARDADFEDRQIVKAQTIERIDAGACI